MTTTYWHIAHPSYTGGDLLCRNELVKDGTAHEWRWDEADEGFDGNVVCLFPDTRRGRVEADWLWSDRRDHHLLRVELPDNSTVTVDEGYPAVEGFIAAEHITLVHTGYAANAVTHEGDEY